ncbi:MAG: PilZ domain-containing protein [Nitrospira sp.]|nr:PilZ domain-containing protein [bacterium]MBL7048129.1 PilZ domain-containing protein [Nitrospira sp.]
MLKKTPLQKRIIDRIESSLMVKFINDDEMCYGLATNVSEKGMCINSGTCLPSGSEIQIFIPLNDEMLEIPATVRRVEQNENFYDCMGVELKNFPKRYKSIIEGLRQGTTS